MIEVVGSFLVLEMDRSVNRTS